VITDSVLARCRDLITETNARRRMGVSVLHGELADIFAELDRLLSSGEPVPADWGRPERAWGLYIKDRRTGEGRFWRQAGAILEWTEAEARAAAEVANFLGPDREAVFEARRLHEPPDEIVLWGGVSLRRGRCPAGGPVCLACERLGAHLEPVERGP
jgi:hypothetical protein